MFNILSMPTGMTADVFIACLVLGAAMLAFWVLVRFERFGPRSLVGAVCGWVASGALIFAIPACVSGIIAVGFPEPRLLIIFGLVLPIFTYFFLAGAWFMRTLLESATGVR